MKLVKILPGKTQIKTDDVEFQSVRLNDLISVSDGKVELVTQICAITDNDVETQMDDNAVLEELEQPSLKVIECAILGSVVDGIFKQQIDHYPSTDVDMVNVDNHKLFRMSVFDRTVVFKIGKYAGYDVGAYLDGNKFFQRHSCIVGNTGCGKSETVAKILEETAKLPGTNIVVFDIHGEYSNLSYVDSIKMGEVPFPIWMLGFSDMVSNVLKVKEDSTVAMSALRKAYHQQQPNGNEGKPVEFNFSDFLDYMEYLNSEVIPTGEFYKTGEKAGQSKTNKGEYNGKLSSIVNTMSTLKKINVTLSFLKMFMMGILQAFSTASWAAISQ